MAGTDNLRPMNTRTKAEQREIARLGGIASGEARRRKKTLAEIGDMIGGLEIKVKQDRDSLLSAGVPEDDLINDVGMMYRLNVKAQNGDPRAIELLAKLRGQFKEQVENYNVEIIPILPKPKKDNK